MLYVPEAQGGVPRGLPTARRPWPYGRAAPRTWHTTGSLACRGTSVRLRPQRCVLVLHGVRLERKVLQTVEASGLGGYLPCTLESMHVAELELVSTRRHTIAHPGPPPGPPPP